FGVEPLFLTSFGTSLIRFPCRDRLIGHLSRETLHEIAASGTADRGRLCHNSLLLVLPWGSELPALLSGIDCQRFNDGDVLHQVLRQTIPFIQELRAVVREPDLALA